MACYLILHGLGGSTGGHWQERLAADLASQGHRVLFPAFPQADDPDRTQWLKCLNEVITKVENKAELIVVAHSLGCTLWLHYAAQRTRVKVRQAILVSPPASSLEENVLSLLFKDERKRRKAFESMKTFFPLPDSKEILRKAAVHSLIIGSSDDPFLPGDSFLRYSSYQVPMLYLPNMGHINVASGYGPWHWMQKFCQELASKIADPAQ
ncbi:MAG: alpha/beta fold hydrolase [Sporolactobacillus sp.]